MTGKSEPASEKPELPFSMDCLGTAIEQLVEAQMFVAVEHELVVGPNAGHTLVLVEHKLVLVERKLDLVGHKLGFVGPVVERSFAEEHNSAVEHNFAVVHNSAVERNFVVAHNSVEQRRSSDTTLQDPKKQKETSFSRFLVRESGTCYKQIMQT